LVFSSHVFLFYFLPFTLLLYYLLPRRGKHAFLTLISYVFYGWSNPLFTVLMMTSTLIDYWATLIMVGRADPRDTRPIEALDPNSPRTRKQKIALIVSIASNLSLLGFFKYFNFAAGSYDSLVNMIGLPGLSLDLAFRITLPLGISFYTFQSMSYTIDTYRGEAKAQRNFLDFACYVSMFPQLVAGPIIRYREIADQLERRTYSSRKFARGIAFISFGLAKKILLANPCGTVADLAFDAGSLGAVDAWVGATAYAFQIYFDFSGYSDIAIGLGLMLGFVFAKNFDRPYISQSITEFWRRWHISLSSWLRDYLYIPLGGNRKGSGRLYVNLAIAMLLGGLWHGAAWNFVVWGGIQGSLLIAERLRSKNSVYHRLPPPARVAITFVIVLFAWVFFRAHDLPSAIRYCGSMLGFGTPQAGAGLLRGILYQPYYFGTMIVAAVVTWSCPDTWDFTRSINCPKAAWATAALLVSILVLCTQAYNPFIYFIF